jgi:D-alanyl-D-alanine carboxypeptidase (penicillin-binding protein 5/6)
VPVWKGSTNEARLGVAGGLYVALPKGEGSKLKTTLERTDPLVAPLERGQRVGTIRIAGSGERPVATLPLVVLEPVPLAGLLGRAWDSIRLWIR